MFCFSEFSGIFKHFTLFLYTCTGLYSDSFTYVHRVFDIVSLGVCLVLSSYCGILHSKTTLKPVEFVYVSVCVCNTNLLAFLPFT